MIESISRGVLDTRLRGYDDWCVGGTSGTTNANPTNTPHASHSTQDRVPI